MKPDEIRKLLGGYATGTLTEEERNLLFTAALDDQVLFDALANEESLRALLDNPEARGHLLAVVDENDEQEADLRNVRRAAMSTPPSPMQASAMLASDASSSSGAGTSNRLWYSHWPKGIALAGALVIVILIVAVVSTERNRSAAVVEVAKNEQPLPVPSRQEASARQVPQAPAAQPANAATPSAGRRDAPALVQTPPGPTVDAQQGASGGTVDAAKDLAKESERKTEQKDEPLSATAAANAVQSARVDQAPAAPPALAAPPPQPPAPKRAAEADLAPRREAPTVQGFAAGLVSKARSTEARSVGTVTDINGTIVSVSAGTGAGLKNGDTLEIVRAEAVLGTVRLTDTRETFAVGSLTRNPGADPIHAGDSARLQTPSAR